MLMKLLHQLLHLQYMQHSHHQIHYLIWLLLFPAQHTQVNFVPKFLMYNTSMLLG